MKELGAHPAKAANRLGYAAKRNPGTRTVASLGKRVRLIPADPDREQHLASLLAACETLRADCERLFRQIADLLQEDALQEQGRARSARPSNLERDG
jgi:hypothetical protein